MSDRVLLRGGRVIDPASGTDEVVDVVVAGSLIESVGAAGSVDLAQPDLEVRECEGLIVAPGFVDMHTHLREPGGEDREDVRSGTRAAAVGGFTAVTAMANTNPVADNAAVVAEVVALAEEAGWCDVSPVGAITKGLQGRELTEMGEMAAFGVRMFSDDGKCVPEARTVRMALEYAKTFGVIVAEHCEDASLTQGWQMHEGATSARLGLGGAPRESEEVIVARDILMARLTGGRLHLCHLSSAGSVELVRRAKAEGLHVTAEVTPHHLALIDEDLKDYDTNFKVNPPMRAEQDRLALIEGLADGTIDVIATDHAPHAVQEKEREFDLAPPGMTGLETALGVAYTALVEPGHLTVTRLIEALSTTPARILGLRGQGGPIRAGEVANLVVFDPKAEWVVATPFASKSRNSAFLGRTLRGRVVHTLYRGRSVVVDGQADDEMPMTRRQDQMPRPDAKTR